MSNEMSDESPFLSMEIVERPLVEERENMWDMLVDMCETDADLAALMAMRDNAEAH